MTRENFKALDNKEMLAVNGGLTVGGAILAGCVVMLVGTAAVNFYNGYSDAAGK